MSGTKALTHEEAVRVARSGEGAVVGELTRLSALVEMQERDLEQREKNILEYLDRLDDYGKALREIAAGNLDDETQEAFAERARAVALAALRIVA